jgi:prophage tail gpP-like protein
MNISNRFLQCIFLAGLFAWSAAGSAGMYKWTDADGNVQYTQQPPPDGIEAENLKPPPRVDTETAVEDLNKTIEDSAAQAEAQQTQEEEAAKTAEEQRKHQEQCDQLNAQLAGLHRPRISTVDEEGNRVRMSEEERQSSIQKITEIIEKNCK